MVRDLVVRQEEAWRTFLVAALRFSNVDEAIPIADRLYEAWAKRFADGLLALDQEIVGGPTGPGAGKVKP